MQSYSRLKLKYPLYFPVRWVFRDVGTDVTSKGMFGCKLPPDQNRLDPLASISKVLVASNSMASFDL